MKSVLLQFGQKNGNVSSKSGLLCKQCLPRFLCTKISLTGSIQQLLHHTKSIKVFLWVVKNSLQSMMFAVIVWFFKQLFNSNGDDKRPNSPPKSREKITHVRPFVDSWMVSPRLISRPGIFSYSNLLSLGIHFSRDRSEKWSIYHNILLASSSSYPTKLLRNQARLGLDCACRTVLWDVCEIFCQQKSSDLIS